MRLIHLKTIIKKYWEKDIEERIRINDNDTVELPQKATSQQQPPPYKKQAFNISKVQFYYIVYLYIAVNFLQHPVLCYPVGGFCRKIALPFYVCHVKYCLVLFLSTFWQRFFLYWNLCLKIFVFVLRKEPVK